MAVELTMDRRSGAVVAAIRPSQRIEMAMDGILGLVMIRRPIRLEYE